jgi:poly-gamma-glutamate synthesis protein (capsule biosynthesis protein)
MKNNNYKILFFIFVIALTVLLYKKTNMINNSKKIITIGLMGDVMIGRLINNIIKQKGYQYIWGNLLNTLKQHDVNLINLETTLTNATTKEPKVFNFKSDPQNVTALKAANITVATLANNHSLDFKNQGLLETTTILDRNGIKHIGAGATLTDAQQPIILTISDIKIGFIGWTDNEPTWKATNNKPGTNYIRVGDTQTIIKQIKQLRETVDILIVTMHWGPNKRQHPTQQFIDYAHAMIDAGADVLHGHSAHIFQGIEIYKNKLIIYDSGDFIDDYAIDSDLRNDQSLLFQLYIDKNGLQKLIMIPVLINNMQVNYATGSDYQQIVDRIITLSTEFDTIIREDNGRLIVHFQTN